MASINYILKDLDSALRHHPQVQDVQVVQGMLRDGRTDNAVVRLEQTHAAVKRDPPDNRAVERFLRMALVELKQYNGDNMRNYDRRYGRRGYDRGPLSQVVDAQRVFYDIGRRRSGPKRLPVDGVKSQPWSAMAGTFGWSLGDECDV